MKLRLWMIIVSLLGVMIFRFSLSVNILTGHIPANNRLFAASESAVDWIWSGGVTDTGVHIKARLLQPSSQVRLAVSSNNDLSSALFSDIYEAGASGNNVVSIPVTDLLPVTQYYYALEVDGQLDLAKQGRFRTFAAGAFSFDLVVAADANEGSNSPVFDQIAALAPDLYINTGDFFYADIDQNIPDLYYTAYNNTLRAARQANLYRQAPIAYMWDDHDFGANNSNAASPSRQTARQIYQEYVPHYPLAAGSGDVPIYQAFTVGRARFILTDLRSERSVQTQADNTAKTMMGETQKAWFKQELLAAKGRYPLIVWVSSVPWIAHKSAGGDHWGGYTTERAEIANFIEGNQIQGLIMLASDAHMVALDDGSHNTFSDTMMPLFPVLQAAALNRGGSIKGGPYSHGAFPNPTSDHGQFALITVTDTGGDTICVNFSGRRLDPGAENTVDLLNWGRCFEAEAAVLQATLQSDPFPVLTTTTQINYTLNFQVMGGPVALTGLQITQTIPASTTFVSASHGGVYSAGQITWSDLAIPTGDMITLTFTINITGTLTKGDRLFSATTATANEGVTLPAMQTVSIVSPELIYLPVTLK